MTERSKRLDELVTAFEAFNPFGDTFSYGEKKMWGRLEYECEYVDRTCTPYADDDPLKFFVADLQYTLVSRLIDPESQRVICELRQRLYPPEPSDWSVTALFYKEFHKAVLSWYSDDIVEKVPA